MREATRLLIGSVSALPPASVTRPSLLPGWTRGHVLAHLARNADAYTNLLVWARTGIETPMYPSAESRDKDIEDGAGRPLPEHLDDLRISADRLAITIEETPARAWAAQVAMRSGRVIAAAEIPWRRLVEVLFHHIDLGIGFGCDQLPEEFAGRELASLIDDLSGHEGISAVRLHDTDSGKKWNIGAAGEPALSVSGTVSALLGWVSGRTDSGLTVRPDLPLPTLPALN
jgi:maleylpyruvate isomerase